MNIKVLLSIFFCLTLVACTSSEPKTDEITGSQLAASSGSENKAEVAEPKDQMICKDRPITGSRFKQKTCMTAEQWRNMANGSKNMVESAVRVGVQGNPDGG